MILKSIRYDTKLQLKQWKSKYTIFMKVILNYLSTFNGFPTAATQSLALFLMEATALRIIFAGKLAHSSLTLSISDISLEALACTPRTSDSPWYPWSASNGSAV